MRDCKILIADRNKMSIVTVGVPRTCLHLSPAGCNIYDLRPKTCRDYDGRKDILLKDICKWKELKERGNYENSKCSMDINYQFAEDSL